MTKPIDRYTDLLRQGGLPEVYVLMAEHEALTSCISDRLESLVASHTGLGLIHCGFFWTLTKDGHSFWQAVAEDWEHHLNHMVPL